MRELWIFFKKQFSIILLTCAVFFLALIITHFNSISIEVKNLTIANTTNSSTTIIFTTNKPAYTQIEIKGVGKFGDDRNTESKSQKRYTHFISVNGLSQETEYDYSVVSGLLKTRLMEGDFKTSKISENITSPIPAYGLVKNTTQDDSIIILSNESAEKSIPLGSLIQENGGYVIDLNLLSAQDLNETNFTALILNRDKKPISHEYKTQNFNPFNTIVIKDSNKKFATIDLVSKVYAFDEFKCGIDLNNNERIDENEWNFGPKDNGRNAESTKHWCECYDRYGQRLPQSQKIDDEFIELCRPDVKYDACDEDTGVDYQYKRDSLNYNPIHPPGYSCESSTVSRSTAVPTRSQAINPTATNLVTSTDQEQEQTTIEEEPEDQIESGVGDNRKIKQINNGFKALFDKNKIHLNDIRRGSHSIEDFVSETGACYAINANFYHTNGSPLGLYGDTYGECFNCPSRSFVNTAFVISNSLDSELNSRILSRNNNMFMISIYPTGTVDMFDNTDILAGVSGAKVIINGEKIRLSTRTAAYSYIGWNDNGELYAFTMTTGTVSEQVDSIASEGITNAILLDGGGSAQMYSELTGTVNSKNVVDSSRNVYYYIGSGVCEISEEEVTQDSSEEVSIAKVINEQIDAYCSSTTLNKEICKEDMRDEYIDLIISILACENNRECDLAKMSICRKNWIVNRGDMSKLTQGCQNEMTNLIENGSGQAYGICQTTNRRYATGEIADLQGCIFYLNGGISSTLDSGAASNFAVNNHCQKCYFGSGEECTWGNMMLRYPKEDGRFLSNLCNDPVINTKSQSGYFLSSACNAGKCDLAKSVVLYLYNQDNGVCENLRGEEMCSEVGCLGDSIACWYGKKGVAMIESNRPVANGNFLAVPVAPSSSRFKNLDRLVSSVNAQPYANHIEIDESGNYTFELSDGRTSNRDIIVEEEQIIIKIFEDSNGNGVFDEGEEYINDYGSTKLSKKESIETYKFDIGWNLIHIPIVAGNFELASELIEYLNSSGIKSTQISRYADGMFSSYIKRESNTVYSADFSIYPGMGVFIKVIEPGKVNLKGKEIEESMEIIINNGWNLIGIASQEKYNSGQLLNKMIAQDIRVNTLSKYQNSSYQSVVLEDSILYGTNFNINKNAGYFLRVDGIEGEKRFRP